MAAAATRSRAALAALLSGLLGSAEASDDRRLGGGTFLTNAPTCTYAWTPTTRTAMEALEMTFPKGAGWADACFVEAGCTGHTGMPMSRSMVANWIDNQLLGPDPFGAAWGGRVPLPCSTEEGLGDQLGHQQFVGYSRRQVCYIGAKALLGASTENYDNGLSRILATEVGHCAPPVPSVPAPEGRPNSALTGDFGVSLWNLMAACAADPLLQNGEQGPMILVAKGSAMPDVTTVREAAHSASLRGARLSACRYDDGDAGPVTGVDGLEDMSQQACTPPTTGAPGKDFMTTSPSRPLGQAVQDISAEFLGGYVFGNACGLGGGQDERLMTYMPEVFILAFFLSQDADRPQLREPAFILGARILMHGLDGSARFNRRLEIDPLLPLFSDLVDATVGGTTFSISQSSPFLAFMSENQDFLEEGGWWTGEKTFEDLHPSLVLARRNRHPRQRATSPDTWYSFMYQVRHWYAAVALSSYAAELHPVMQATVKSLGTGPFLAGLWWGDSQLGFLTVWIAQAIAASTWGDGGLPVQYYIYSDFTENPGNQCFVHGEAACKVCLDRCSDNPLPPTAFWLPQYARMGPDATNVTDGESCVVESKDFCGQHGMLDVVARFKDAAAGELWDAVEQALESSGEASSEPPSETVFDLLLAGRRLLL